ELSATREPSGESLERRVATCDRFPELFEFVCAGGLAIRPCAARMAAPRRKTVLYLKTEDKALAQRGDWFVVFIIGATLTKNLGDTRENYATTLRRCHLSSNQKPAAPD